jgi:hypothetical protein
MVEIAARTRAGWARITAPVGGDTPPGVRLATSAMAASQRSSPGGRGAGIRQGGSE